MEEARWLLALDALSGLLLAYVAYGFVRLAWRRRDSLLLLFAAGIAILAVSYPAVSASQFDFGAPGSPWDELRAAGQTGGALVVLAAYATARLFGRARPALALGWAIAAMTVLACVVVFVLPQVGGAESGRTLLVAHATMALAWLAAAALAGGRAAQPAVPIAFAAFAVGKVAWVALDAGSDALLLVVVYFARFLGIVLLVGAVRPSAPASRGAHAAA